MDDRPPILGSWKALYVLVLATLAACILAFSILTRIYAP
jgi:hypothetical protein